MPGGAYGGVVRTEHRGPGGGHARVVAPGFVPVAQVLRHPGQIEGERQHQRVGVATAAPAGRVCLLQHPAGRGRVVRLPVQPGQQVRTAQQVGMVLPVRRPDRLDRVGEQSTGGGQITGGAQGECLMLSGGQGGRVGHVSNAAGTRRSDATRADGAGTSGGAGTALSWANFRRGQAADGDVHDPPAPCTVTPRAAHQGGRWVMRSPRPTG